VATLAIVKDLDVFPDGGLGLCAAYEGPMSQHFILEASPEALDRCIVVTISFAGHGDSGSVFLE
jgi:hypothetical protein